MKYGPPYTVFTIDGNSVAGAIQFGPDWGVTPQWSVFFSVRDDDACVAEARKLGGTVEFSREVPETGRLRVLRDSEGARFVVMRPNRIKLLADELMQVVDDASVQLRMIAGGTAAAKLGPDVWSIKEILGHLIDSAANNHQRFVRALHVERLTFPGYEQDDWVRSQDYQSSPWNELIEFRQNDDWYPRRCGT
ncbi:MAG: hypothetical protein HY657_17610 [Acidobacteria bacterium]|nr:hypothetical protein [Acidobacteriota bacterium]